ncbi:hypothetical protein NGRA_0162 [Nosema granulosis]|uniref:Uncharacterized protein n=1 Tax=Nosema granulosis TaxID=83296 RepID=A0A9P6H0X0_9MICR|nr:hypothetical protein NGRA_0162 [Nosema granulosis]
MNINPYFYDTELQKICQKTVLESLETLLDPYRFVVYDKMVETTGNPIVFISISSDDYFTISFQSPKKYQELYNEIEPINENNYVKCIETVSNKVKKLITDQKFDVYFTLEPYSYENTFFEKKNFAKNIELIIEEFQKKLNESVGIVRYHPTELRDYITKKKLGNRAEGPTSSISFSTRNYEFLIFLDDNFKDQFSSRLTTKVQKYEEEIMKKLSNNYMERNYNSLSANKKIDIYILSIISELNKTLKVSDYWQQADFLFVLWDYLMNKKTMFEYFSVLFVNAFCDEKETVESYFKEFFKSNKKQLANIGLNINETLLTSESRESKYYFYMNVIANSDMELHKSASGFISALFSILIKDTTAISKIILSNNINVIERFNDLRKAIYQRAEEYYWNSIEEFSKYVNIYGLLENQFDITTSDAVLDFNIMLDKLFEKGHSYDLDKISVPKSYKDLIEKNYQIYGIIDTQ